MAFHQQVHVVGEWCARIEDYGIAGEKPYAGVAFIPSFRSEQHRYGISSGPEPGGQRGVVGQQCVGSDETGIGHGSLLVHECHGEGRREDCALFAAVPGNVSVGAFRPLELYPRTPERLGGDEADIEPATFGFEYPGGDFRSRLAKHPYASSCHFGIGVDHPYGHTPETFLPEQQTARGSLAVM